MKRIPTAPVNFEKLILFIIILQFHASINQLTKKNITDYEDKL